MKSRFASLHLLGACALLSCVAMAAHAQVDMQAVRAYLRTGANEGSEVTTPALGQEVFVHVDYRIVGGTAPFSAVVRALVDGEEQCMGAIEDFQPNADEVIWCPGGFTATAGTHTLRWELDTQNNVVETNETNNVAELTFTTAAAGLRDLEALRAYLRTEIDGGEEVPNPTIGQEVYFHLDYRVGGAVPDFKADVSATIDDQPFCSGPITFSPAVDGVVWCPTAWTATPGTHTLRWVLDGDNKFAETNEDNNAVAATFGSCVGDCNNNNFVVVSELITGVNIALDRADIEACPEFDRDSNGKVAISELVSGVDNLLRGCR